MTNETPPDELAPRQFRAWTSEWNAFEDATKAIHPKGRSPRAAVLRDFMLWYMRRPGAKLPDRPAPGPWSAPREEHTQPAE
ncbi:hypothetical protein [Kitasatospora aureofaciens]|uniref:hypothetical protein n=1 Tax=Kitasatospora aureofaciens TaxID=1894 RepID=UPI0033ED678F